MRSTLGDASCRANFGHLREVVEPQQDRKKWPSSRLSPMEWSFIGELTACSSAECIVASSWVALGVTTQGSHRPGRARISASGSSTDRLAIRPMVPEAIRSSDGDMSIGASMCSDMFPSIESAGPTLRFPPQGPPGRVPLLQRYYQGITTSCRPSHRTSFPSLGGTSVALAVFAPGGRVRRRGLELVTRYLRPGTRRGDDRISQVPGEPQLSVRHVPNRRRQDCLHQTIKVQQRGPWYDKSKGSRDWVFRRSIAWLSDSLLYASQCRLPRHHARLASSRWSGATGRASHPQGSDERFQSCPYISSPFPKLLGAMDATDASAGLRNLWSVRQKRGWFVWSLLR